MAYVGEREIAFVIGAGASVDFGFPIGAELANEIRRSLDTEFSESAGNQECGPLRLALNTLGFKDGHQDAARQLRAGMGMGESIDQFLFRRRTSPMVRDLGLMAVAQVILDCERRSILSQFDLNNFERSLSALRATSNSWPVILLDQLIETRGPEEINEELFSQISFVIFNYDRCVEQIMFHHLHRRHHLEAERALGIVRSIPMLHIYGVLGDTFDGPVPFGAASADLFSVARGLQTYHEEISDVHRQAKLTKIMSQAQKVCFLGFGFLPENFARLFPENETRGKQLSGTMMGCQDSVAFNIAQRSDGSSFRTGNCTVVLREFGAELLRSPWKI
jgi:hypothetical protein